MAKNQFKVFDSDLHIMEPPDLWQRYINPKFKDRAPRGLSEITRDFRMVGPDGKPWGRRNTFIPTTGKGAELDNERYRQFQDGGWTAQLHLGAMDNEGIDVAVLFPTRGLYALTMPDLDPDLAAAIARAYNDWLHEFCQTDPTRLFGAAMLSPYRVEDAVEEARRCVQDLGFKSVFLRPNQVNGRNWHDPYYDPLWSAIVELNTRLGFHEGRGSQWRQIGDQFANAMLEHVVCHPLEQMVAVTDMIMGGVLARHPKLVVAFLEANCSWLPFMLWRLDEHWEREGDVSAPELTKAPSEYFKTQCFASVECDEAPVKYTIADIGDDRLVYSTDFPHIDAKYPHATDAFMELELSDDSRRKILWDNCRRYYGFAA